MTDNRPYDTASHWRIRLFGLIPVGGWWTARPRLRWFARPFVSFEKRDVRCSVVSAYMTRCVLPGGHDGPHDDDPRGRR